MKKFLFLCGRNKFRSLTAEHVFSKYDNINVRSAGLHDDAEYQVDPEDIKWADYIFCMEQKHKDKLTKKFKGLIKPNQKVIVLNISDKYKFMDPELIRILEKKVKPWV